MNHWLPKAVGAIMADTSSRHSPCVSVLISDLLLHLRVCQGLQQGAPLVSITCVSNGYLHCGQRVLTAKHQKHFSQMGFTWAQRSIAVSHCSRRFSSGFSFHVTQTGCFLVNCETWSQVSPRSLRGSWNKLCLTVQRRTPEVISVTISKYYDM